MDTDEIQALIDKTGRSGPLLENFAEIDQDESGELKSFFNKDHSALRLFNKVDQNDSGGLDILEIEAMIDKKGRGNGLLENFAAIDTDGNGEISSDEIRAFKDIDITV